jgi:hypothetical protein
MFFLDCISPIIWPSLCLACGAILVIEPLTKTLTVTLRETCHVFYFELLFVQTYTGTPIQNNALELWSLFDFLMPGFLGSERQFNETYAKHIKQDKDGEKAALALETLHRQVRPTCGSMVPLTHQVLPFLLRRMKEDVLTDLPPKIIQDYYCELTDVQNAMYKDFHDKQSVNPGVVVCGCVYAWKDAFLHISF